MKKTLSVILIISFILAGSVSAFGQKDFFELVKTGTLEEVNNAIKAGADVNARDKDGKTPLLYAAWFNQNPDVIKVLLEAGANVNARGKDDRTSLMYAARYNPNPEVIKVLLEAGADVNARDKDGMTSLMYAACFNQNPDVIKVLLEAGADVNAKDKNGKTPLVYAAGALIAFLSGASIAFLIAIWVYSDAKKRGKSRGSAFLWFLGTFLLLIVFLPIWLITRPKLLGELPITRLPQLCPYCGKYYEGNPSYCPNCGHELKSINKNAVE